MRELATSYNQRPDVRKEGNVFLSSDVPIVYVILYEEDFCIIYIRGCIYIGPLYCEYICVPYEYVSPLTLLSFSSTCIHLILTQNQLTNSHINQFHLLSQHNHHRYGASTATILLSKTMAWFAKHTTGM